MTRKTKREAEEAAFDKLGELDAGGLIWSALDPERRRFLEEVNRLVADSDFDQVRAYLSGRRRSAEVRATVAAYLDHKQTEAGLETGHLRESRRYLEAMASSLAGRAVADITPEALRAWWEERTAGRSNATRNAVRKVLVAFWNWCVWRGDLPKEVTAADRLPKIQETVGKLQILTPRGLLEVARAVDPRWRAWVVLGAFCGFRPEELSPGRARRSHDKRGLLAEEIDWNFRVIRVPPEVSKVKRPRTVPLSDAAAAWLEWAGIGPGSTGPVCALNPVRHCETARLGREVFGGRWPQDVLRHSYASHRNAVLRNLAQVAEEMGTSERMLHRHYHNPRTAEEGEAWFALRPEMIRLVPMDRGVNSRNEELPLVVGL